MKKTKEQKIKLIEHQKLRLEKLSSYYVNKIDNNENTLILNKSILSKYALNILYAQKISENLKKYTRVIEMHSALYLKSLYINNPKKMDYHRNWYYGNSHYLPKDFNQSLLNCMKNKIKGK